MGPGIRLCSCPPARGAAGLQQHRGIMSVRSTGNRRGGECSGFLMAQVEPSEKAQPFMQCDTSRLGATMMHSMAPSHHLQHFNSPASPSSSAQGARSSVQGRVSLWHSHLLLWECRLHGKPWHSNHSFPCGLLEGISPGDPTRTLVKFSTQPAHSTCPQPQHAPVSITGISITQHHWHQQPVGSWSRS